MQHTKILDREAIIQIAILIVSGAFLLASFAGVRVAGFDPAWIAIVFCGLPILKEAAIGLITEFDIRADVLVSLALIAAVAIGEYFAAGEVALIMQIGGLLEELTVKRAQAGLERLVAMTPETARIVGPDGTETVIPAEEVKAGDTVRVIPGEKVPVDGEILDGITSIDQSVLTGEPVPVDRGPGAPFCVLQQELLFSQRSSHCVCDSFFEKSSKSCQLWTLQQKSVHTFVNNYKRVGKNSAN